MKSNNIIIRRGAREFHVILFYKQDRSGIVYFFFFTNSVDVIIIVILIRLDSVCFQNLTIDVLNL